jgi:4-hydroxy-tetrahydrodipicolinate reductase
MTVIGVSGATGQMGGAVIETAAEREDVEVAFGIDADTGPDAGVSLYEPSAAPDAIADHDLDAIVDFSVPEATIDLARECASVGVPLVVGTTGFEDDGSAILHETSEAIPLLKATNFSRGIQALLRALGPAVDALPGYDVEVTETHHNRKRDAPSGTAKTLLAEIDERRDFGTVYGREGIQPREEGEVGVHVRRAGDIRGEHEVVIAGNDEVVTLSHRAEDRGVFAAGAIDAAIWLVGSEPGRYGFGDVVGEPTDR